MPIMVMLGDVDGFSDEMMGGEVCFPEFLYFSREIASLLGSSMSKGAGAAPSRRATPRGGETCFLNY
jgi:hypothetical protein